MKSTVFVVAALSALVVALPDHDGSSRQYEAGHIVARQVTPPSFGEQTVQGCFKSSGSLVYNGAPQFNSRNSCANETCAAGGFPVGGTMGGQRCWCGQTYPPKSDLVDDSNCNVPCKGYPQENCGGVNFWTIYNTGINLSVQYSGDSSSSSSSTTSVTTSTPPPTLVVTRPGNSPGQTVVVIQTPTGEASQNGSGTNVAGIVAGVVVGVVVIASAIGGGFLYMRRKRNREIEEEHRRNAAVNAFIGKPPGSSGGMSMTDSRMDPVLAQRRLSDGSIADNQDYSRRILRVTNA